MCGLRVVLDIFPNQETMTISYLGNGDCSACLIFLVEVHYDE